MVGWGSGLSSKGQKRTIRLRECTVVQGKAYEDMRVKEEEARRFGQGV